ncbi:MAG: trigger factor [Hyphomicrobiales bacterium]
MQVTNTLSEGLKREFSVVLPAPELEERLSSELALMKDKIRINGFRPGKVPVQHLRRVYGRSVMAEVVQRMVNETNQKIIADHGIKLALEPKIVFPENESDVEAALSGKSALEYKVSLEILPNFAIKSFSDLKVSRPVASIDDNSVDDTMIRLATQNRVFTARKLGSKSKKGDRVTIDFIGMIADAPFEGGTGTDVPVEIGSGSFIPGFEDQLVGVVVGETLIVKATFPETYAAQHLAGKEASFNVTVKGVEAPGEIRIDNQLAISLGMESLDKLKEAVRANIVREYEAIARRKTKRALLDQLDTAYDFDLPPSLVEQEFNNIWQQVESDMQRTGKTFADEDTTEDAARAEYLTIAKRRVRLGLLLAEIGDKAAVQVSDEEMSQGLMERARQFPGQEKMVWDFYRNNPQALAEIRAPLFEDKVVDHILASAVVTDRPVSKEELLREDDDATSSNEDKKRSAKTKAKSKVKSHSGE